MYMPGDRTPELAADTCIKCSTTSSHLFPLGCQQRGPYHFSTTQTIDYYFRFLKYQFSVVTYLANQVASTKIFVAKAAKVVTAWRVEM